MARKAESLLRSEVIKILHPLHVVPVENGMAGVGTPDLNYGGAPPLWWLDLPARAPLIQAELEAGRVVQDAKLPAREGWIELKIGKIPVRSSSRVVVTVRPEQRVWWERRSRAGGRVHVLTKLDDGSMLWTEGRAASAFLGLAPLCVLLGVSTRIWPGARCQSLRAALLS